MPGIIFDTAYFNPVAYIWIGQEMSSAIEDPKVHVVQMRSKPFCLDQVFRLGKGFFQIGFPYNLATRLIY